MAALSAVCAVLTGLIVLAISVRALGPAAGAACGILFICCAPIDVTATFATPDAMLMVMMAGAAVALLNQAFLASSCLLIAATLIRSDSALFNLCLAAALMIVAGGPNRRHLRGVAVALAVSGPLIKLVEWFAAYPGFGALYRFTIVQGNDALPDVPSAPLGVVTIGRLTLGGLRGAMSNGGLWMIVALLIIGFFLLRRSRDSWGHPATAMLVATGLYTCARFLLFPESAVRFAAPSLAVLSIVVVTIAGGCLSPVRPDAEWHSEIRTAL